MPASTQFREERSELEAVLNSGIFARSPNLAHFLRYICERYFEGHGEEIKEYNVAVEALGRPADFDQKKDSIVRVEAHRLRKRLHDYYGGDGKDHLLHITIPSGNYVPVFHPNGVHPSEPLGEAGDAVAPADQPPATEPLGWVRWAPWVIVGLVAIALAFAVAGWKAVREAKANRPSTAPVPAAATSDEIRILAGSTTQRLIDDQGNVWVGDRFFTDGEAAQATKRLIQRTHDPAIYLSRREGPSKYDIPLKPGSYELRLHFAETVFGETNEAGGGESSRVFAITLNGHTVETLLDVLADAGGANTALVRVYKNVRPADDGMLHIEFAARLKEKPFVNAIEIIPTPKGGMLPIRIMAAEKGYTSSSGVVWEGGHRFVNGGQTVQRRDDVAGTDDQELFRFERFGNFSYAIPVAAHGHYTVRLGFCEHWFGPGRAGGGGKGSRIFDVYCNRKPLLKNFDIFADAGSLRATIKTFSGLEPNPQGVLYLEFVPVNNYALVNFIEVLDEDAGR
jgi:hypothetical protein